jgi:hypothetical protein
MPKAKREQGVRTLLVKFQSGRDSIKKVTIPAGCKVTFGPLCPGSKSGNGEGSTALRIYNGPTTNATQIACFVKVESFYEMDSVKCIQKVTNKATKVQKVTEDGIEKQRNVSVEVSEWKDELDEGTSEAPKEAFMSLKEEHDDKPF